MKMFAHPLEKYCNALANSKTSRIATLSPWYGEALLLAIFPARLQLQVPCSKQGTICCEVTGTRCYSEDLPRGGLEIPCKAKY